MEHGVRGPCGVGHGRSRFFKNNVLPQNGENRPSLGFFECIGKFRFFLNSLFFSQFGL